ncbi:putative polyketide synthase [Stachybotrys elegans]|uniref:Polyketide synthase n=1 Tax=Stachybotrys elegans TaxID=80388 RepID=A0A8K0SGL5_9HYPO|nr:putative polyketide synthase [Stachybotrys elegans]
MARPTTSAAIFSPQNSPPKRSYLAYIRSKLVDDRTLAPLLEAILSLPETWRSLVAARADMAGMVEAPRLVQSFVDWINAGSTDVLENELAAIVTLPLLTIIHMVQYYEYLQGAGCSHMELLESFDGGVQGHCIGLLSAIVVASAANDEELVQRAAAGLRLSLAIGAFGDLGEHLSDLRSTTMVFRLKDMSAADEIVHRFPGTYISTTTDSRTVSMVVPGSQVSDLRAYADKNGLQPRNVHIRSRLHDATNTDMAQACRDFCDSLEGLPFGAGEALLTPVRSNRTGSCLSDVPDALSTEVIDTILLSMCNWTKVMAGLVADLKDSSKSQHTLALFGIGDSVPLELFRQGAVDVTKFQAVSLAPTAPSPDNGLRPTDFFPSDAIAIVGAGFRLPGASTFEELWELISEGKTRLEPYRADRSDLKGSYRAGQDKEWTRKRNFFGNYVDDIDAFDHSFFGISPREAKYMDPQQRLLLLTAWEAMDSAGMLRYHRRERGDNVGCFVGASFNEYVENTSGYSASAFTATGTIRAFLSGKVSYHFGWTGPSEVIDTACSASIVAVHRACQAIKSGECPVAVAGGVNLITGFTNYFDLAKASFLSPTGQCKPFDDSGDGYCRSDGVGLVVLKSLSQAVADGDHIMGVIPSIATNQGGIGAPGITVPDGIMQRALYKKVLTKSGLRAEDITYVEAHGTGTPVGDPIEIRSIREVFGGAKRPSPLYLGSLKANVGHSETAAGVASLLKVLTMFREQGIPPIANFKKLNHNIPALEPDRMMIPTSQMPWNARQRVACINSYGASGSNSALILSEWSDNNVRDAAQRANAHTPAYPILLSANSKESLQRYAGDLATYLARTGNVDRNLGDLAFTLSERRKHHRYRWSTTAADLASVVDQLQSPLEGVVDSAKTGKKVVLAFSGQSRTNIGVDPFVIQAYPRFLEHMKQCSAILQSLGCPDILPYLSQTDPIADPVILQCGTVSVQIATARCWMDGGVQVDGIVGHSLGELASLAISGVLSLKDTLTAVYTRAQLINLKWGPERGTMMAIHAKADVVQSVIAKVKAEVASEDDEVEIACYNSVGSHVIVGRDSSIAVAEKVLQADAKYQGLRYQRVGTSHGFHSRFTKPLLLDLVRFEKTLDFKKPIIPLETCTQVPFNFESNDSTYLAHHARDPVYFYDAVQRLEKRLGPCAFLEAGWGTPVVSMAKKAVADATQHTFQAVTSPATATANLWREGCSITFWSFLTPKQSLLKPIWTPPYSFDNTKSWLDHVDNAAVALKAAEEAIAAAAAAAAQGSSSSSSSSSEPRAAQLVRYKGALGENAHEFGLSTSTERFTKIVSGHAVKARPLCPASVYMESAIMGCELLGASGRDKTISFTNISFQRPLGINDKLDVKLHLSKTAKFGDEHWHYSMRSSPSAVYSEGDFTMTPGPHQDMELYALLASDGMVALRNDPDAEKLRKRTAYSLFSRVVEYSDLMQGISDITFGKKAALATIQVPNHPWASQESSVSGFYDAISLDTFIQVVGLLINCSSGTATGDEVYIASSIGNLVVSPTDFQQAQTWTVYATYSTIDSKTLSGAIFVFNEAGELVSFGSKIHFHKTSMTKLLRVLDAANPTGAKAAAPAPRAVVAAPAAAAPVAVAAVAAPAAAAGPSKIPEIRALISAYTGVKEADIPDDVAFASLGLDSLSAMELAGELESSLGIKVSSDDVTTSTVASLAKMLPSGGAAPAPAPAPVAAAPVPVAAPAPAPVAAAPVAAPAAAGPNRVGELRALISAFTGIKEDDIADDVSFGSLGLDSLSAMELASEMESTLGLVISSDDIASASVSSLSAMLGGGSADVSASKSVISSTVASTTPASDFDNQTPELITPASECGPELHEVGSALGIPWKRASPHYSTRFRMETVVYKEIDGTEIPADIYLPAEVPSNPMPIALMIHGGGHLTLSRRAVRPPQTSYLLANGILPVSIDYRLAPHVNVVDGSMADTRDACVWLQKDLPELMAAKGIIVDPSKYVVIGFSTGGTLALTTAWTTAEANVTPPRAILSFYCPVEYDPDHPVRMGQGTRPRTMTLAQIRETLPSTVAVSHSFNALDTTKLGWLQPSDPRSELTLALIKEENGMSLLFNGLPEKGEQLPRADPARCAYFSPLTQLRAGNYNNIPTFMIFGEEDEVAPFRKGVEFGQALKEAGIRGGFHAVKGGKHIFDLALTPGSQGWAEHIAPGYDFIFTELENAAR